MSYSPTVNEDYNLQNYLSQNDKILLSGRINNNLDIHMELKKSNQDNFDDLGDLCYDSNMLSDDADVVARYEGTYYYDKYMKNIRIAAQAYSNGYINIFEFDENNQLSGSFGGFIYEGKILKGMWNNNGVPKYQFYLIKSDTKTNLKITLEFDEKTIKVVGNDVLKEFAGAHVTMSGTFVKE